MASKRDGRARSGRKSAPKMPAGSPTAGAESASRPGGHPAALTPMTTGNAVPQPAAGEIGPAATRSRVGGAGGGPTEPSSPAAMGPAGPSPTRDLGPSPDLDQSPNPSTSTGPRQSRHVRASATVKLRLLGIDLFQAPVPVAVISRFENLDLTGQNLLIDQKLWGVVRMALGQDLVDTALGELTFLPLSRLTNPAKPGQRLIAPENLLVVGLGDLARFSLNDYRYLFMKIVMAVKLLEFDGFGVSLVNASRVNYKPDRTLQAIFDGISDAYERLHYIKTGPPKLSWFSPLRLVIAEPDPFRFKRLEKAPDQLIESPREQEELALLLGLEETVPPNAGAGNVDQVLRRRASTRATTAPSSVSPSARKQGELEVPAAAKPAPDGRFDDDRPSAGSPPASSRRSARSSSTAAITDSGRHPREAAGSRRVFHQGGLGTKRLILLDLLPGTVALRAELLSSYLLPDELPCGSSTAARR